MTTTTETELRLRQAAHALEVERHGGPRDETLDLSSVVGEHMDALREQFPDKREEELAQMAWDTLAEGRKGKFMTYVIHEFLDGITWSARWHLYEKLAALARVKAGAVADAWDAMEDQRTRGELPTIEQFAQAIRDRGPDNE